MQYHTPAWRSIFAVSAVPAGSSRIGLDVDGSGHIHYRNSVKPVFPPAQEKVGGKRLLSKYMKQLGDNLKTQKGQAGQMQPSVLPHDFPDDFFSESGWELMTLEAEYNDANTVIVAWSAVLKPVFRAFEAVVIQGERVSDSGVLAVTMAQLKLRFTGNRVTDLAMESPVVMKGNTMAEPLKIAPEYLQYLTSAEMLGNLDLGFRVVEGRVRVRGRKPVRKYESYPIPSNISLITSDYPPVIFKKEEMKNC